MDVKRYFRGPVMWIVLAVLAVVVLMQVVGSSGGKEQIAEIFAPIVKRPARPAWTGSARRTPSTRPPVLSPKELALTNGASTANGSAAPPEIAPTDLTKDIAPSTEAIPEERPES
ncbi:ATP-dependent zinc metalloprotease FtsH OS=Streptomyces microflavus OX=1919 GN=ftsH PE=3 SV=1 [Streptomyces microflavus]